MPSPWVSSVRLKSAVGSRLRDVIEIPTAAAEDIDGHEHVKRQERLARRAEKALDRRNPILVGLRQGVGDTLRVRSRM
jgi:hypothetical protein